MKWILHLYDVNELVLLTLVEKLWYDNKWSSLSKMRTFRNVWNGYISKPLKFEILNKIKIYLNLFIPYCTIYYISLGLNQKLRSLFQFNCQKCADTHNARMIRFFNICLSSILITRIGRIRWQEWLMCRMFIFRS